ncbi:phosphopantetheine-binding protein [Actinoplanes sp. NPDC049596]|uniref:phosphopantetheine-binding protein n=1 Tax=unclassified Actinoplanes TaxID=2626549 RepID=UPI0034425DA6
MLNDTGLTDLVRREINAVLLDDEGDLDYTLDDEVVAIGLNSLMLAQLLLRLEAALGADPFGGDRSIADVRTVRDLVEACAAVRPGAVEVRSLG